MTVACLGWGSLIWRNDGLPCDGDWRIDGPLLPIEFARMSRNGEVTLVIVDGAIPVPVLWSLMPGQTVAEAAEALRVREGKTRRDWIGTWSGGDTAPDERHRTIGKWAMQKGLSGVVWTALPPKWGEDIGHTPSKDEILAYLGGLSSASADLARRYITEAPDQIKTRLRPSLSAWANGLIEL